MMRTNGWKAAVPIRVCLVLVAAMAFLGLSVNSADAQDIVFICGHDEFGDPIYGDPIIGWPGDSAGTYVKNDPLDTQYPDGHVDGVDFLDWAGNYGSDPADPLVGHPRNADYNNCGQVDGVDYLIWARYFNTGPLDSTVVPEPSTMGLGLIAGLGMVLSPRRRRRRAAS